LSADETVDRIHRAGGVAIACHPYALFKGSIGQHVTAKFDAVETINASSFPFRSASSKAEKLAQRFGLPRVAGTDAHYGPVIGCAYTVIDSELNLEAILEAIVKGRCEPAGGSISLRMRIQNQGRFVKKYLKNSGRHAS
jgi:predicted metal-dependent phosphoesterase TrpH